MCVNDSPSWNPFFLGEKCPLRRGAVYHVEQIIMDGDGSPMVIIEEVKLSPVWGFERGFDLTRFDLAALPRCLTELLETAAKDVEAVG